MKKHAFIPVVLSVLICASCSTSGNKKDELSAHLQLPDRPFSGDVYVDFQEKANGYPQLAVLPFKAAVELSGASVSDFFTTELLKTSRYSLIERSQIETVLKEQELSVSGVTENDLAVKLGKVLGVKGVVIGSISEYGFQRVRISRAPSIGLSVRMINTTTGKIVWSVSHSAVGDSKLSLSQHATKMIEDMVYALSKAWVDAGDTRATGLPPPAAASSKSGVRTVRLEWNPHVSKAIVGYDILRRGPGENTYTSLVRLRKTPGRMSYEDKGLLDLTLYRYEIRTISKFGMVSAKAAATEAITAGPPQPPKGLSAIDGMIRSVTLSWIPSDDPHIKGYILQRHEKGADPVALKRIIGSEASSYTDKGTRNSPLKDSHAYSYTVKSFNTAYVESEPSASVTATTKDPPAPVTRVSAADGMPRSARVKWAPNPEADEVAGYRIYVATEASGPFVEAGTARGRHTAEYTVKTSPSFKLEDNTTYHYRVAAYNTGGAEGDKSAAVKARTKQAPPAVEGLTASKKLPKRIELKWKRSDYKDIDAYAIYRISAHSGRATKIATVHREEISYTDTGHLQDGDTYSYKVAAVDKDELVGAFSNKADGSTKAAPCRPQGVTCKPRDKAVAVSWAPCNESDIVNYLIYKPSHFGSKKLGETRSTTFVVPDLKSGKTYRFAVVAVDADGLHSARSETVSCKVN